MCFQFALWISGNKIRDTNGSIGGVGYLRPRHHRLIPASISRKERALVLGVMVRLLLVRKRLR